VPTTEAREIIHESRKCEFVGFEKVSFHKDTCLWGKTLVMRVRLQKEYAR